MGAHARGPDGPSSPLFVARCSGLATLLVRGSDRREGGGHVRDALGDLGPLDDACVDAVHDDLVLLRRPGALDEARPQDLRNRPRRRHDEVKRPVAGPSDGDWRADPHHRWTFGCEDGSAVAHRRPRTRAQAPAFIVTDDARATAESPDARSVRTADARSSRSGTLPESTPATFHAWRVPGPDRRVTGAPRRRVAARPP